MPVPTIRTRHNYLKHWNYRQVMAKVLAQSIGRRKTSVARLRLESGKGNIVINNSTLQEYFPRVAHKKILMDLIIKYPCWEYVEIHVTPNKIIPHIDNNISFDLFECKELLEHTMKCLA